MNNLEHDMVWTVEVIDSQSKPSELVLCGGCMSNGRAMVRSKKANFRDACMWCGNTAPDLRPILREKCECWPPIYKMELGHRKDKTGEQVPCILLACVHSPCEAHIVVDYDWPNEGKPQFSYLHEGH